MELEPNPLFAPLLKLKITSRFISLRFTSNKSDTIFIVEHSNYCYKPASIKCLFFLILFSSLQSLLSDSREAPTRIKSNKSTNYSPLLGDIQFLVKNKEISQSVKSIRERKLPYLAFRVTCLCFF
jgi:hypothetical protein